jgi:hypothetical protein
MAGMLDRDASAAAAEASHATRASYEALVVETAGTGLGIVVLCMAFTSFRLFEVAPGRSVSRQGFSLESSTSEDRFSNDLD